MWICSLPPRSAGIDAMRPRATSVSPNQPDPNLLHDLYFVQQVCLALVVQLAIVALCARPFSAIGSSLPHGLIEMHVSFAIAALLAALSLFLADLDAASRWRPFGRVFVILTAIAAVASFFQPVSGSLFQPQSLLRTDMAHILPGFALLFISIILIAARSERTAAVRLSEAAVVCLHLLVAILVSEYVFGLFHFQNASMSGLPSISTLASLSLLTVVLFLRVAERGVFKVFLGPGIAGKTSRIVIPIFLVMPFLREVGRARLLSMDLIPQHSSMVIFASLASVVSFALLFFLVSCIERMETRIHDLTLRDELTGLYNVRGFNLLAGQSLRLAQRAETPFSILFVDMDNLKRINDELGHSVGSSTINETAKLLTATFREADVIARMGGDEFVVAGQFSHEAVVASAQRLQELAASRFCDAHGRFPLSLSIGYATSCDNRFDSLKELLGRADQAMYDKKRRKKAGVSEPFRTSTGPVAVMPVETESFVRTFEIQSPS
jgi:diguanylate cyclase (GGDEF)-like protein